LQYTETEDIQYLGFSDTCLETPIFQSWVVSVQWMNLTLTKCEPDLFDPLYLPPFGISFIYSSTTIISSPAAAEIEVAWPISQQIAQLIINVSFINISVT